MGASGFLGQGLVGQLQLAPNADVRGFSRTGKLGFESYSNFSADLSKFDFVVNASVGYGRSSTYEAYQANVEFPIEIVRRLIAMRSTAVFVNLDSFFTKFPIPFYSQLKAYSLTKSLFPDLAASVIQEEGNSGLRLANFRIEHVFGAGDSPEKFLMWLRNQIATGVSKIALTEGTQKRDFIHISDASRLIGAAILRFDELDLSKPLEVGTGQSVQVKSFVQLAAEVWGYKGHLAFGEVPGWVGEIQESMADPYLANTVGDGRFLSAREGLSLVL